MTAITLFVAGVPVPQGSMKGFVRGGRAVLTSANPELQPWRTQVAAAFQARCSAVFDGPIVFIAEFIMPRTKALPKTRERPHTTKPDADKLVRGLLDAIRGIAIRDDAQVVEIHASKRYARVGERSGAHIRVEVLV